LAKHRKRSSRELAEYISEKIMTVIKRKVDNYAIAKGKNDHEGMYLNSLSEDEYEFVQAQQRLDQDADHIDANSDYLNDMPEKTLDRMYERLARDHDKALEIPPMPDLEDEDKEPNDEH